MLRKIKAVFFFAIGLHLVRGIINSIS